jgi:WD40 repeat protein
MAHRRDLPARQGIASTAQIRDAFTGAALTPPMTVKNRITHVEFSGDGRRLLTVSSPSGAKEEERLARVWDTATGRPLTPPLSHLDKHSEPIFNRDGSRLLTTPRRFESVRLFDTATGRPVGPSLPHLPIWDPVFSPDGRLLVTGSKEEGVQVWEAATGRALTGLLPHALTQAANPWPPRFSPDSRFLLTAEREGMRLWNAATGRAAGPELEAGDVWWWSRANFSGDGRRAFSVTTDMGLKVWDLASGRPLTPSLEAHPVADVSFAPGGNVLLNLDRLPQLWDISAADRPAGTSPPPTGLPKTWSCWPRP